MSAQGRPFRFLALVSLGWVGARIAILWPQTGSLPEAIKALAPIPAIANAAPSPHVAPRAQGVRLAARLARPAPRLGAMSGPAPVAPDPLRVQMALMGLIQYGPAELLPEPSAAVLARFALPAAAAPDRIDPLPDRWTASGWLVARAGSGIGAAPGGGQLGGSQAGLRVAYLLSRRDRIAAFARLTTPLAGKGREAAIGLEWQPAKAPVRLVAEQRFGLDGTPGGAGLGIVTGIDTSLRNFRLEAYGQAGAIRRKRIEPYADGALRVTHPIAPSLALGAGAWGGAQRDAQRLDIGPSVTLRAEPVRVSLDWRQRIAGRARPGSGLALTLGGDF